MGTVSCPSDSCAISLDLGDDRVCRSGPNERFGLGVVIGDEGFDLADEVLDAPKVPRRIANWVRSRA